MSQALHQMSGVHGCLGLKVRDLRLRVRGLGFEMRDFSVRMA